MEEAGSSNLPEPTFLLNRRWNGRSSVRIPDKVIGYFHKLDTTESGNSHLLVDPTGPFALVDELDLFASDPL